MELLKQKTDFQNLWDYCKLEYDLAALLSLNLHACYAFEVTQNPILTLDSLFQLSTQSN